MTGTRWNSVAVIGVGLVGGSIGRALLETQAAREVVGIGRRRQRLARAQELGVISRATTELAEGVADADVVVACTPVRNIVADLTAAAAACPADCLLTDAGSTKRTIVEQLTRALPTERAFVGSHPLAGSEKSGFEHARADLFRDRWVVLTPTSVTPPDAVVRATEFWTALGARVTTMPPDEHDRRMAWVSHLPHAVAAILAGCTPESCLELAASGWRDTTRVAAGDPALWKQIFQENRGAVADAIDEFAEQLRRFRQALDDADGTELERQLAAGKLKRDAVAD